MPETSPSQPESQVPVTTAKLESVNFDSSRKEGVVVEFKVLVPKFEDGVDILSSVRYKINEINKE